MYKYLNCTRKFYTSCLQICLCMFQFTPWLIPFVGSVVPFANGRALLPNGRGISRTEGPPMANGWLSCPNGKPHLCNGSI